MIADVAGLGVLLLQGPVLVLLSAFVLIVAGAALWGCGYRAGRRDQARWAVAERVAVEVARAGLIPGQRQESP